jgi:hypothetical protein
MTSIPRLSICLRHAVCARGTLRPAQTTGKREVFWVWVGFASDRIRGKDMLQPPTSCGCASSTNEQAGGREAGEDMLYGTVMGLESRTCHPVVWCEF